MKELLKQLIVQNKNQQDLQHEILQMKSTLKDVLEMQITSIQDIQKNIVVLQNDYLEKFSNISIPSSISDPKRSVNCFTPVTTEIDASHDASSCEVKHKFQATDYITNKCPRQCEYYE